MLETGPKGHGLKPGRGDGLLDDPPHRDEPLGRFFMKFGTELMSFKGTSIH
jgi:hypothetical protein